MEALSGGNGGLWGWNGQPRKPKPSNSQSRRSKSSDSVEANRGAGYHFPVKQAATAASLALTGDTIAQIRDRWRKREGDSLKRHRFFDSDESHKADFWSYRAFFHGAIDILLNHDWLRALRMASYGFLFYGPGSYAWYRYLDRCMPQQTVRNIMLKVLLNQIVLGPCVISVVFAWNNLWLGKLSQLPSKYQKDALPTLLYGFRFWIPVSALNFWVVPLQARVAFMSMGSIFWNFYLSATMCK